MTDAQLQAILTAGAQAPSGDNLQPWLVARDGERGLAIAVDRTRDQSLYNYGFRASLIALGALVENLSIAARHAGYDTAVTIVPAGEGGLPSCRLAFAAAPGESDPLIGAIPARCTNRRPYQMSPLKERAVEALTREGRRNPQARFRLIANRDEMKTVAHAASLNDRLLFEMRRLHDDLYSTVRWTEAEAEATRDGLFVKTLELGPMGPGFTAMRSWRVTSLLNAVGSSRFAPQHSYRTFLKSSAFGFLQMQGLSPEAYVEGGRVLERLWLTATAEGLSFQPMAGTLYLLQYLGTPVGLKWKRSHQELLGQGQRALEPILGLDSRKASILLFRVGYGPAPSARSLRRSLA